MALCGVNCLFAKQSASIPSLVKIRPGRGAGKGPACALAVDASRNLRGGGMKTGRTNTSAPSLKHTLPLRTGVKWSRGAREHQRPPPPIILHCLRPTASVSLKHICKGPSVLPTLKSCLLWGEKREVAPDNRSLCTGTLDGLG
ncbi:hypothetical protein GN956_G17709 [Arapaima gigas]